MLNSASTSNPSIVFTAAISDRVLTELPRFFGGLEATFRELYQNAWRAGATTVTVTYQDEVDLLTFVDNGVGCPDPRVLVTGGETGWSETAIIEPAGLGFFSLMNPALVAWVEVRSADWQMRLVPEQVLRKERLSAVPATPIGGLQVTLCLKRDQGDPHSETILAMLRAARGLYPYHVTVNGEESPIKLWQPEIEIDTPVGKVGLRPNHFKDMTRAIWEWRLVEGGAFRAALHSAAEDNPLWHAFARHWNVYWIVDEHRCGVRPKLPDRNDLIADQAVQAAARVIIETCVAHLVNIAREITSGWPSAFKRLPGGPAWLNSSFGQAVLRHLGWRHTEWDNLEASNFYYVQDDGWSFEFEADEMYIRRPLVVNGSDVADAINNAIDQLQVKLPYAVLVEPGEKALKVKYAGLRRAKHLDEDAGGQVWLAKRITLGERDLPFMLTEHEAGSTTYPVVVLAATPDEASRALLGQPVQLRGMEKPAEVRLLIVNYIAAHCEDVWNFDGWVTTEWGEDTIDTGRIADDLLEQVSDDFIGGQVAKARERYHRLQSDLADLTAALSKIKQPAALNATAKARRKQAALTLQQVIDLVQADLEKTARLGRLSTQEINS